MESEEPTPKAPPADKPPLVDRDNLKDPVIWTRFAFMVLYFALLSVVLPIIGVLALVQFLFVLFKADSNIPLQQVTSWLNNFYREALSFITYESETKPFPFNLETNRPVDIDPESGPLENT